ncbi:MAG: non-hydrolyzing UDP-N-acetylglucosamine 2-epimerase [Bradymonadaceae bacterium]
MIDVLTVVGTRPEAIKLAPVVRELDDRSHQFDQTLCATAQHREMLDQVLDLFELEPDVDLDLMTHGQGLEELTGRVVQRVGEVVADVDPDVVLVQGDTTTTFGAALAAFYEQTDVGHVEAGLRTGNRMQPWPEEINRRLTSVLGTIHFPPTRQAAENLLDEGVASDRIHVTGNTVIDALLWVSDRLDADSGPPDDLVRAVEAEGADRTLLDRLGRGDRMVLITGHRRENFGEGFRQIVDGIRRLASRHPDCIFVYPVHLNPEVQRPVRGELSGLDNVFLLPPLDYAPFVHLMNRSTLILTDSGGIQEEAPSLGKPVLVMRETTERPEAVEAGTARLVGADAETIVEAVTTLLSDSDAYEQMAGASNPFGDGRAAERIADALAAS